MSTSSSNIPKEVADDEIVLRTIFSPANIKNGKLKANFMRPPIKYPDEDNPKIASNKLSVTRVCYMGIEFCRQHGRDLADHAVILQDPDINAKSWQGGDFE